MTTRRGDDELVVLLDEAGSPCGTARKADVHNEATPLHLAFSCWVLERTEADTQVLLTRRSAAKRTWPLAWTNTFCGHPGPDEPIELAVHRRAADELGATVDGLELALPDFRYTAVMADGTRENEVCPVFTARLAGTPDPRPDEVEELRWVGWDDLVADVAARPQEYSPWMREQLPLLTPRPR